MTTCRRQLRSPEAAKYACVLLVVHFCSGCVAISYGAGAEGDADTGAPFRGDGGTGQMMGDGGDAGQMPGDSGMEGDGGAVVPDAGDLCPDDVSKVEPGVCGCGVPDEDYDANGTIDCPMDVDNDSILEDGDFSGVAGDNPCRDGVRVGCDDNCPMHDNPWQDDGDNDGVGDACDPTFCRKSDTVVVVGRNDQIYFTTDHGQNWTASGTDVGPHAWEDVIHGRDTWVTGNGDVTAFSWARSSDGGQRWTLGSVDGWSGVTSVEAVGYADGLWMLGSDDGRLAVSHDDGLTFRSLGTLEAWDGLSVEAMAFHEGRLIAVGDGRRVAHSENPDVLDSWQTQRVGTDDLKNAKVVHGTWVIVGAVGACYFSRARGETWTACGAPAFLVTRGLGSLHGTWMLGRTSEGVLTSSMLPGSWTSRKTPYGRVSTVYGDCQASRWIASSYDHDQGKYTIVTSDDNGMNWDTRYANGTESLYGSAGN